MKPQKLGCVGGPSVALGAFRNGCQYGQVSIADIIVVKWEATWEAPYDIEKYLARKWRVTM